MQIIAVINTDNIKSINFHKKNSFYMAGFFKNVACKKDGKTFYDMCSMQLDVKKYLKNIL